MHLSPLSLSSLVSELKKSMAGGVFFLWRDRTAGGRITPAYAKVPLLGMPLFGGLCAKKCYFMNVLFSCGVLF